MPSTNEKWTCGEPHVRRAREPRVRRGAEGGREGGQVETPGVNILVVPNLCFSCVLRCLIHFSGGRGHWKCAFVDSL